MINLFKCRKDGYTGHMHIDLKTSSQLKTGQIKGTFHEKNVKLEIFENAKKCRIDQKSPL